MTNRDPKTYAIIGAAMEVHKQLGPGFLEKVYQEALAVELDLRGVPFKREIELPIFYKNIRLTTHYRADFLCFDDIIVELKALSKVGGVETSQVLNYLKATNHRIGLLLNFGTRSLGYDRFIN